MQTLERNIRHYIYQSFTIAGSPPTPSEIAEYFNLSREQALQALEHLAAAHHIALAPGSHNIWMAHPFSGVKTDFVSRVDGKTYWGN